MRQKEEVLSGKEQGEFPGRLGRRITLYVSLLFILVLAVGGLSLYLARSIWQSTVSAIEKSGHVENTEAIHSTLHHLIVELNRAMITRRLDRLEHVADLKRELGHQFASFSAAHKDHSATDPEMVLFRQVESTVASLDPLKDRILSRVALRQEPDLKDEDEIERIAHLIPALTRQLNGIHYKDIATLLAGSQQRMKTILWIYLAFLLGGGILLFLGNLFFSRQIALPLTRLAGATSQVAAGDLKLRVPVASRDEIGLLSHSFNLMAQKLEIQDRVEKDFQQQLERIVRERTRELKEANQTLEQTQERMVQLEKLRVIGEMYAGLTHEINNPLGIILSKTRMLLADAQGNPGCPELVVKELETIGHHASRIAEVIRGLLTFARREPFELAPLELNELLKETVALVEKPYNRMNIYIEKELGPHLPNILGNWNQLQQVFLNLLSNARDALSAGGTIKLRTSQLGRAGSVRVEVADNGTGIAPEHLPKLFEPFFTTKDVGKGTGLGLSVSYGIVKAHGGDIWVVSQWDKGSCFTLSFPALEEVEAELPQGGVLA